MAQDRINRKLDLIMEHLGIDTSEFTPRPAPPRKLTPQEQQAIDNAPRPTPITDTQRGPRVTAQNAPDTSSSVPVVPADAVGTVTVETRQPDGKTEVTTKPASEAKHK
jgi:hypothetical protein